jgi:hypothetical protein
MVTFSSMFSPLDFDINDSYLYVESIFSISFGLKIEDLRCEPFSHISSFALLHSFLDQFIDVFRLNLVLLAMVVNQGG